MVEFIENLLLKESRKA